VNVKPCSINLALSLFQVELELCLLALVCKLRIADSVIAVGWLSGLFSIPQWVGTRSSWWHIRSLPTFRSVTCYGIHSLVDLSFISQCWWIFSFYYFKIVQNIQYAESHCFHSRQCSLPWINCVIVLATQYVSYIEITYCRLEDQREMLLITKEQRETLW